jgi:Type IV secretory pathway, VirB11 components, and related ATPases involved in archaeal flagella biosynthesis
MEKEFSLDDYLSRQAAGQREEKTDAEISFDAVCDMVRTAFDKEWNETDDDAKNRKLEREKKAIIGFEEETRFYKEKIREILREKKLSECTFPPWYPDICEAVFAEIYGLAGLAPWAYDMKPEYENSSSAKLIGDRLYCLIDGRSQLQPQRIPERRRRQLKRTLLLATPRERLEYGFHEVYLHNGIRITIYSGDRTKKGQDVMVFRKYVLKDLTFEKMAELKTIPEAAADLFKLMVKIGFNVIFTGQVRSGKTTFLQTWQRYEDPMLEGIAIATDPETPWHVIMPNAPLMQITADGTQLETITKSILRGDNDYCILEEMRDGTAYDLALSMTSMGTMRSKVTIHDSSGVNIPYKMASKIRERYGGDLNELIAQVYKNFDYVFEFCQLPSDKSRKIMSGITAFSYDPVSDEVRADRICSYDFAAERWLWKAAIDPWKRNKLPQMQEELDEMDRMLGRLSAADPLTENTTVIPAYYHGRRAAEG